MSELNIEKSREKALLQHLCIEKEMQLARSKDTLKASDMLVEVGRDTWLQMIDLSIDQLRQNITRPAQGDAECKHEDVRQVGYEQKLGQANIIEWCENCGSLIYFTEESGGKILSKESVPPLQPHQPQSAEVEEVNWFDYSDEEGKQLGEYVGFPCPTCQRMRLCE